MCHHYPSAVEHKHIHYTQPQTIHVAALHVLTLNAKFSYYQQDVQDEMASHNVHSVITIGMQHKNQENIHHRCIIG